MSLFLKIRNQLGLKELFNVIPKLKFQVYKFVFFSLLISTLDLLSLSLIGIFIISLFTGVLDNTIIKLFLHNFSFFEKLSLFSVLIIVIYLVKAVLSYKLLKKIIEFCFDEQTNLRKKYLDLYFSNFETLKGDQFNYKISSVIEYIRRITENYLVYSLRFISDCIILLIIIIFLLVKDFQLTILLMSIIFVSLFIYIKFYRRKITNIGKKTNLAYKQIVDKSFFIFGAFKEIKIHNKENEFILDFLNESKNYTNAVKSFSLLSNIPRYYAEFIFVVFILLVSVFTLKSFGANEVAYSIIGVYSAAAARLAPLMNNLTQSISIIWNNRDSALKVEEFILDKEYKIKNQNINNLKEFNTNDVKIQKISIKDFHFSYGEKKIYKNVNLEINKDKLIGIYGNSGSGKTTLINSIIGFLKPDKGKICFVDNHGKEHNELKHNFISYIPQEIRLMSETIAKNISLELNENKINYNKINKVLEISNSKEFVDDLENRENTILHSNGQNLSGGQKQRIAIARALYNDSQILIFDEPFSSLDEKSEQFLLNILNKIKIGKIILIITHKKNISHYFDEVLTVDETMLKVKK